MKNEDIVIVAAARTPIGVFNGSLAGFPAHELGSIVIKEVLKRANLQPSDVSEVVMGQTLTAGAGQNPARQAAVKAGLPYTTPAFNVNMLCGSGLKAVALGTQSIKLGEAKICVCGGQESMSQAPHTIHLRSGVKMGPATMQDHMLHDGLTDAFHNIHMGVTAENVATKYKLTREEQDKQAVSSHQTAVKSQKAGHFRDEIVPITITDRKLGDRVFQDDEMPNPNTSMETLSKLKPAFVENGTVTAGNASGRNDGAGAVVLMTAEEAKRRNLPALGRVVAVACGGVDPTLMGMGPVPAVQNVLAKAGWKVNDVDLYELNEAYAASTLACNRDLGVDPAKVNVSGGAIALGHPVGGSGARVLVTLLYALKRTGGKKGVASLCIGGGMGIAIAVERE